MIANNLRRNLEEITRLSREAGAEVLVVVQPQNEQTCAEMGPLTRDGSGGACSLYLIRDLVLGFGREEGVALVDVPTALRQHAGRRLGEDYFYDPIHLTRLGNEAMGASLTPAVARLLGLEP